MYRNLLKAVALLSCVFSVPSVVIAEEKNVANLGQDPSRPLVRADLRYSNRDVDDTLDRGITTLRFDRPFLRERWTYFLRMDLTYVRNTFKGVNSVLNDEGIGPTTLVAGASYNFHGAGRDFWGADAAGFGIESSFDTTDDEIDPGNNSKSEMAAILAAKWSFDESAGFFFPLLRYWWDTDKDKNASDTDLVSLQPFVNFPFKIGDLPSFISLYQTFDIRYNFDEDGPGKRKGLHLPANIGFGVQPLPSLVLSLDYAKTVVDDYERYDSIIEFRVGHFF